MSAVRADIRATVRTLPERKSGTLDNGGAWSHWVIEVLDSDANKVALRVPEGYQTQVGSEAVFVVDIDTRGRFKATVVDTQPVKARAAA